MNNNKQASDNNELNVPEYKPKHPKIIKNVVQITLALTINSIAFSETSRVVDHRTSKVGVNHNSGIVVSGKPPRKVPSQKVSVKEAEKARNFLTYTIPKDMQKKLKVIQWEMKAGSVGRPILSGNRYQLVNLAIDRGMKRQVRTVAANLGFSGSSKKTFNMLIKRQAGDGQVRYGDRVALNLNPYGWLKYKKQKKGINLSDDNNNPHYMWIVSGGQRGKLLVSGMPFALYNTTEKAEMVYCVRSWGINLGWHPDSKCGGNLAKLSNNVFGENGLFARDGLSGAAFVKAKDFLCDKGVKAGAAYLAAQSAGIGAVAVAASPTASKECKKL